MVRRIIQILWAIITNGYFKGFIQGRIYSGKLKYICVPGLNCYSCPGSLGSCPIGSLQAVVGSAKYKFSFYIVGFFLLIGTLLGRFICGFLCPFGLFQELLNKIRFPLKIKTFKYDHPLRYLKYFILIVFVIIMPMVLVDAVGNGSPWFCKLICPAGTLEGGIPLVLLNPMLRETIGFLFGWKIFLLIVTIFTSIIIFRPFCKYICPLGAIYAMFNKISFYRYKVSDNCTKCKKCEQTCPMNISPYVQTNHAECIRCGVCKTTCPTSAISNEKQFCKTNYQHNTE